MKLIASAVFLFLFSSGATVAQAAHNNSASKPVTVDIKNAQGQSIGTAVLSEAPYGVKIKVDVKGLAPGGHPVHIHQVGKCESPDFKSAGGHFDPTGAGHAGHDHSALPAGDIPDFLLIVTADGTAHVSIVAPNVTLGSDDHSVFSNGGTALVIHSAGADASRIACGVITK